MVHLLSVWPQIAERLKAAAHIWLFADFDGTLTPIVQRPEQAILSENNRQLLEKLAVLEDVTLGVISGRAITDLKELVQVKDIIYAGNHGLEIEGPGIKYQYPIAQDIQSLIRALYKILNKALSGIPGVIIEDKGLTISVHYRQVDRNRIKEVKDIFTRTIGGLKVLDKVRITKGKEVLEVRPAIDWNKGKAVKLFVKRSGKAKRKENTVPIYLGDDSTDEDAFRRLARYDNSITVFVGSNSQKTEARYYLNSPDEVTLFLQRTLELLQERIR
ncbi:MAG: trehalose-phosphatase [Dehalococcoidales bacterium]|nr:trehalose-phosphatase [Dehalococcoidales bacterium]